jgi:hypothetical protein
MMDVDGAASDRTAPPEILGREEELAVLRSVLVPGGAALILGPKGMGKTALLSAVERLASQAGFTAGHAATADRNDVTLSRLLGSLGITAEARMGSRALERELLRHCDSHRCAMFLDDADRANAGLLHTLRRVALETSACTIAAARTGPADAPDRLRRAVLAGKEVRLGPLSLAAARSLARAAGVPPELVDEVARRSGRVPVAVIEMARRHRYMRYQIGGRVAWDLLLADLRLSNRL